MVPSHHKFSAELVKFEAMNLTDTLNVPLALVIVSMRYDAVSRCPTTPLRISQRAVLTDLDTTHTIEALAKSCQSLDRWKFLEENLDDLPHCSQSNISGSGYCTADLTLAFATR